MEALENNDNSLGSLGLVRHPADSPRLKSPEALEATHPVYGRSHYRWHGKSPYHLRDCHLRRQTIHNQDLHQWVEYPSRYRWYQISISRPEQSPQRAQDTWFRHHLPWNHSARIQRIQTSFLARKTRRRLSRSEDLLTIAASPLSSTEYSTSEMINTINTHCKITDQQWSMNGFNWCPTRPLRCFRNSLKSRENSRKFDWKCGLGSQHSPSTHRLIRKPSAKQKWYEVATEIWRVHSNYRSRTQPNITTVIARKIMFQTFCKYWAVGLLESSLILV